jgi:hypothetical protein
MGLSLACQSSLAEATASVLQTETDSRSKSFSTGFFFVARIAVMD